MSIRTPNDLNDEAIGTALRGLPLEAPATSAWAELEKTLVAQGIARRPVTYRRYVLPAALAAALALFLVWPALVKTPGPGPVGAPSEHVATTKPAQSEPTPALAQVSVDRLQDESQSIETWLRQVSASGMPLDGADLMASTEIQDMIGLIDLQLSGTNDTGGEAALWRQRVDLLRDLAAIRTTAYSLAETGVAANGTAASPDTWIN